MFHCKLLTAGFADLACAARLQGGSHRALNAAEPHQSRTTGILPVPEHGLEGRGTKFDLASSSREKSAERTRSTSASLRVLRGTSASSVRTALKNASGTRENEGDFGGL